MGYMFRLLSGHPQAISIHTNVYCIVGSPALTEQELYTIHTQNISDTVALRNFNV